MKCENAAHSGREGKLKEKQHTQGPLSFFSRRESEEHGYEVVIEGGGGVRGVGKG